MRSGKVFVVVLLAVAALGAWLGPAGEHVDPAVAPSAAFFKLALSSVKAPHVYLSVEGKDPSAALMLQFRGVEPVSARHGEGVVVDLASLEWATEEEVTAHGTVDGQPLQAHLVLAPGGKWERRP